MASTTNLEPVIRRARIAYELSRARRALLGAMPVLILVAVAWLFSEGRFWTAACGTGLFLLGVALLWRGQELKRAVVPGVIAGSVPLVFSLLAQRFGYVCTGASCSTLCMFACAVGGVLSGLAVASVGNARGAGLGFWLAASALALLTGALACTCLGVSGVVGLALGYAAGLVPGLLQRALA